MNDESNVYIAVMLNGKVAVAKVPDDHMKYYSAIRATWDYLRQRLGPFENAPTLLRILPDGQWLPFCDYPLQCPDCRLWFGSPCGCATMIASASGADGPMCTVWQARSSHGYVYAPDGSYKLSDWATEE